MIKYIAYFWLNWLIIRNKLLPKKKFNKIFLKKILIIELSRLGDVVAVISAVKRMQLLYDHCNFTFVIDSKYEPIIKAFFRDVDIISIKNSDTLQNLLQAKDKLKSINFDLICSMSPSIRNAYLGLKLKGQFKIGYFKPNLTYTPFLYSNKVYTFGFKNNIKQTYFYESIEERADKILKTIDIEDIPENYKNLDDLNFENLNIADNLLGLKNLNYIVLHPLSGWKFRNWNYVNYANLIKEILANFNVNIILIGSKDERFIVEKIFNLIGKTEKVTPVFEYELDIIMFVIKNAIMYIGNDSGPLHLASLLNVPSIGIFGPASPELTGPRKKENIYFHKKVECCPCEQEKCIRPDDPCVDLVQVDEVYKAAFEVIDRRLKKSNNNV